MSRLGNWGWDCHGQRPTPQPARRIRTQRRGMASPVTCDRQWGSQPGTRDRGQGWVLLWGHPQAYWSLSAPEAKLIWTEEGRDGRKRATLTEPMRMFLHVIHTLHLLG